MLVERVTPETEPAAVAYLARSPYDNVFITHLLLHDRSPATRSAIVLVLDDCRVRGVAYFGRQLALAADPPALEPIAEHAKHHHRGERMIIGPRESVRAFWELVRGWHARPRAVRERQLVMIVDRERLRPYDRSVTVRNAVPSEWSAVADSSHQMISQELDYALHRGAPDFAPNIRQMIERGLWWVGLSNDRLCFFCNVGPWCTHTAQLQGIWTPPELRGRGLATASLAAICDRLLDVSPTLSLYVNDFNDDAIALYERVGFEHISDFQTILF